MSIYSGYKFCDDSPINEYSPNVCQMPGKCVQVKDENGVLKEKCVMFIAVPEGIHFELFLNVTLIVLNVVWFC